MSDQARRLGWGHININVSDLDRSIKFYQKLGFEPFMPSIPYLGLRIEADAATVPVPAAVALGLEPGTRGRACIMQLGNEDGVFPKLDLTEFANTPQEQPLTNSDLGLVRICLVSRNLQADYDRLTGQGVEFLSAPQPGKDGLADIATCVDPDGTLIELLQVYLDRWADL